MLYSIIIMQMLFACSTPINKYLLAISSPLALMSARLLVAGCLLLIGHCISAKRTDRYTFTLYVQHIHLFVKKIVFGSYLKYVLKYWALQYMTGIKMAFLLYTTPFFTGFLSYYLYKEKMYIHQWIGILIGFFGIMPLFFTKIVYAHSFNTLITFSLPECAIVCAVIAHSYGTICTQQLIRTHHYSPALVGAISSLCGGLFALLTAYVLQAPLTIEQPTVFIPWFVVLICLSNIVSYVWYVRLLKKHSTTLLAFFDYLNPFFVSLYSVLFLEEKITWHYILSGITIGIGLYVFNSKKRIQ